MMYPYPMGYKPKQATLPPPEVPAHVKQAAREAGATHIAADGSRAYCQRFGHTLAADWDNEAGKFGTWWFEAEMESDVIEL